MEEKRRENNNRKDEGQAAVTSDFTLHGRQERRRRVVRRLQRAQVVYLTVLALFTTLALLAHADAYFSWDVTAARSLQSLSSPALDQAMSAVSVFGNTWKPWALATATTALFLAWRKRSEAFGLIFSAGGGAALNALLKLLIARPRPSSDLVTVFRRVGGRSFPSGHVTFYVCYFGFLFFLAYAHLPRGSLIRRAALILTATPIALVGLSRIYLGAHWPSDTIGAYLMSGLWLALSLHLYRRWKESEPVSRRGQSASSQA